MSYGDCGSCNGSGYDVSDMGQCGDCGGSGDAGMYD